jgi:A/G-specific adenine glycosylase
LLIAEFLLQKTEATRVVPIYEKFLTQYPTVRDLASASVADLSELLHPLGFHFRAARLCQLAQQILQDYSGKIPDSEVELLKLPGVGKYIARSLCANAFDQPLAVLDTNVARILERFFGLEGGRVKSRDKMLWNAAQEIAPSAEVSQWNLTLLDFGATVCTANAPHCQDCPLQPQCEDWARRFTSDRQPLNLKNSASEPH